MSESMMEWSVQDSKEQIMPGSILMDGWELKKLLGKGTFGDVWLAEKSMFGITEQSAIKIIRIPRDPEDIGAMRAEGFSEDRIRTEMRRNVEDAVREIRAMLDLQNHPAVVQYKSFEVIQYEEDETWEIDIRMQLLTPLVDWAQTGDVKQEDVIQMGVSLSDILTACEKENILHRDIKPANIFVDKLNNFKLGDFGLARAIFDSSSVHSKSIGAQAFIAPEVFCGGQYDHRADAYSLGLVMYWLLNGKNLPFTNKSISRSEAMAKRLAGETLPALPGVDPALDRIVRKACEADPQKRWKNAKEFHDALVNLGAGMREPKPPKSPKKHLLFAATAVLVCAVAVFAIVRSTNKPMTSVNNSITTVPTETMTGSATITENTTETPVPLFTITWQDEFGNTIDTTSMAYGTKPSHAVPEKEADQQNIYTFSGWEPAVENVTGDATYRATFTSKQIPTPSPAVPTAITQAPNDNKDDYDPNDETVVSTGISGHWEYNVRKNRTTEITRYNGDAAELSVPEELDGMKATSIGSDAFQYCDSLTSVTIPDSVTSIGSGTFWGCVSLTSVVIPENVKSIGERLFVGCEKLTDIRVSPDNPCFAVIDGVLFSKQDKLLICYPETLSAKEYIIPQGIRTIRGSAFSDCTSLESIIVPDSVTSIGECAFSNCKSLKSITIPDGVTSIGGWVFNNCTSLKSVTIPDGVTSIGERAFSNCASLRSVTIPDGVASIGKEAFSSCTSLKSITIPDGVANIGSSAFKFCTSLKSATIPDSVASIGDEAFGGCYSLVATVGRDSYARQYCEENGIKYIYTDSNDWLNE